MWVASASSRAQGTWPGPSVGCAWKQGFLSSGSFSGSQSQRPPLEFVLKLDDNMPLPTCMKTNDHTIEHEILPLTCASHFFKLYNIIRWACRTLWQPRFNPILYPHAKSTSENGFYNSGQLGAFTNEFFTSQYSITKNEQLGFTCEMQKRTIFTQPNLTFLLSTYLFFYSSRLFCL